MDPTPFSGERARLIRRLRWYQPTEEMHAWVSLAGAVAAPFLVGLRHGWMLGYCLGLMSLILFQGARYWKLVLQRLEGGPPVQDAEWAHFSTWKRRNVRLLALAPAVALLQWLLSGGRFAPEAHLLWSALAFTMAILEHVNYYHVQLMHDNASDLRRLFRERRLKEAQLAKDLRVHHGKR